MLTRLGASLFLGALLSWCIAGVLAYNHLNERSKVNQLSGLTLQLASRIEAALDYVVIAQTELLISGQIACSAETTRQLGRIALQTGSVSDIYMVTPDRVCSGFEALSAELPDIETRATWHEARNPNYRVGSIDGDGFRALAVSWGLGTDLELVMKISVSALLFDALPVAIRGGGRTALYVGDHDLIAEVMSDMPAEPAEMRKFFASGDRYPVSVALSVSEAAIARWIGAPPQSLTIGWSLFGLVFAAIFVRATVHREHHHLVAISNAIRSREITPHFQPIVDIETGAVVACEALARWTKRCGTCIPPADFIPLVERHDLADELFEAMMREMARTLGPHLDRHPHFRVGFNVTPDQFLADGFAARLKTLTEDYGLRPTQLCIEITERQALSSADKAARVTAELSALGVSVAIDDAGTGHNGLASIQKLSAGSLKLDKFFVDNVHENPRARAMVEMLVSVAREYAMGTVAEGVESPEQVAALKAAGVQRAQGYLFSRPVPAEEMIQFLGWSFEVGDERSDRTCRAGPAMDPDPAAPSDEADRAAALRRYNILDTAEEEAFDRIPRIIKNALKTPMAAIAFIDEDRRWFKAVAGGKRGELPRSASFCNTTIQTDRPTVVVDTHLDPRFRENQLVVGAPHIRAYLGAPLITPDGYRIGSVCCVDKRPRVFSDDEIELVKDLSAIAIEQLELRQMALLDALTETLSRRGFRAECEIALALAAKESRPFSLVALDVDRFKVINDQFGHAVGDAVLSELAARVTPVLGGDAVLGRLGGDEFVAALPGVGAAKAAQVAEAMRQAVTASPLVTPAGPVNFSVSVGVATSLAALDAVDDLLAAADHALYAAKAQGRDCVRSAVLAAA